jgi:CheY-like chemotaxis protein
MTKILIVEDNPELRETLGLLLEGEGFEVSTAVHGQDALDVLRREPELPDLILLDLQMPVMDGVSFLGALPAAGIPHATDVPVLVVTAGRISVDGVAGIIRKPFELDQLLAAVSRLAHRA